MSGNTGPTPGESNSTSAPDSGAHGIDPGLASSLAGLAGAFAPIDSPHFTGTPLVNGNPLGGGGSPSTGQNALTGLWYAEAYGVDFTGATDGQAAMQTVIDAAAAVYTSTGLVQTVYMKQGSIRLNSEITPRDGVRLRGAGQFATTLLPYGTSRAIRYLGTQLAPLRKATFEDFGVDGVNQNNSSYSVEIKGVLVTFYEDTVFQRLYIRNTHASALGADFPRGNSIIDKVTIINAGRVNDGTQPGGNGIGVGVGGWDDNQESLTVTSCYVSGAGRFGIMFERQDTAGGGTSAQLDYFARGIRCIGNFATLAQYGIVDCGAAGIVISSNQCWKNSKAGIGINSGTFDVAGNNGPVPGFYGIIANNQCQNNTQYGIAIDSTSDSPIAPGYLIEGNVCTGNTVAGIRYSIGNDVTGHVVRGNIFRKNGGSGVSCVLATGAGKLIDFQLVGNDVANNGQTDATNKQGIRIDVDMTRGLIQGNTVQDDQATPTQTTGVLLATTRTLTGTAILGNRISATTPITVSATLSACNIGADNTGWTVKTGTPEGAVTAPIGTLFRRTDGGASTTLYIKESGTGNTGWRAV